jgi:hypothetical protein
MDDAVVDSKTITKIFRNLSSKDKNIKLIEGGFHELYADKEKGAIASMMINWMLDRVDSGTLILGQVKNIKLKTSFKNSLKMNFFSKTTFFFVYLFIIRYLLKIREYRESRTRLLLFPLYWIFKIFKISFRR